MLIHTIKEVREQVKRVEKTRFNCWTGSNNGGFA